MTYETKNEKCFLKFQGRFSEELPWRGRPKSLRRSDHSPTESYPQQLTSRLVVQFLPKLNNSFQKQKALVLKAGYFYSHIGLGMCEGVGEYSRHEFGHVDIRVGS